MKSSEFKISLSVESCNKNSCKLPKWLRRRRKAHSFHTIDCVYQMYRLQILVAEEIEDLKQDCVKNSIPCLYNLPKNKLDK